MLLQKGSWKGKELLPEEWVREATSVQITLDHLKEPHTAGYGYQLWIDGREGCFLFKGAFGQICAVIPGKDMVIAYTGGIASDDREKIWDRIWELLVEPAKEKEISWTEEEENRLTKLISSLAVPTPAGKPSWEEEQAVLYSKKKYLLGDNRLNLTSLSMKFAADPSENDELTLALSGKEFTVPVGYGTWLEGKTCVTTDETDTDVSVIFEHVSCAGAWEEGKYRLTLCFDETSYHNTMELTFSRGGLLVNHSRNLSFYPGVNAFLTGAEAPEERKEQLPGDIDINTKLITLLGTPLGQSFAARMQNRGYEAAGLNMRYFYTEMDSRHLGDVVNGIRYMNFAGFAVTKPNKVEILQYLDELDPLCRKMGSCNTVVKTEDGKLVGYNTDGIGFFTSLTEEGVKVEGGRFFCIGSGGAGRAICSVLAYKGAKTIYITDKSEESAKALVEDINENFAPVAVFVPQGTFSKLPECSVIINASGVGMGSSMGTSPLPKEAVCEGPLYFDACYNPDKTQFLLDAEEKGCRILNGLGMSLYQGAAQIELWTGKKAPVDAMRQELLKILKQ
jgi:shikimate dehydrogenase